MSDWHHHVRACALGLCATASVSSIAAAQRAPDLPPVLTLEGALHYATEHYPAVRASLEQLSAARGGVTLARTQYLPQLIGVYQDSRATQNQVLGLWLPTALNPAFVGPLGPASSQSYWTSQGGAFFTWEPLDFGLRGATIDRARSAQTRSEEDLAVTRLQVSAAVGVAFLSAVADERAVAASQASVDRWQTFANTVHVLVGNQLRPGVDAARADAQLAQARAQLYGAQADEQAGLATLAEVLGAAGSAVSVDTNGLLARLPTDSLPVVSPETNPVARDQAAIVREAAAEQRVLGRTNYPKLYLQAEGFARGSGVPTNGAIVGNADGAWPARGNWVAGVTVLVPDLFGWRTVSIERRIAAANVRSQQAYYDRTLQDVSGRIQAARAQLRGARLVAQQTPVGLAAAQQTEIQSRTRYQSGLATIVEVADAENLLTQAEIADAVARLNVWRRLFDIAYAQGDLQDFLRALPPAGGGH
jgi:outer membrane protein TolC